MNKVFAQTEKMIIVTYIITKEQKVVSWSCLNNINPIATITDTTNTFTSLTTSDDKNNECDFMKVSFIWL